MRFGTAIRINPFDEVIWVNFDGDWGSKSGEMASKAFLGKVINRIVLRQVLMYKYVAEAFCDALLPVS